jgi:hypothetical protein
MNKTIFNFFLGNWLLLCCFTFTIVSCKNDDKSVVINGPSQLLQNPFPLNHPSKNPVPNKVVFVLEKGEKGKIITIKTEKDFRVYKVEMMDGKKGYLIHGDNFTILEN